jgi:hypothetical protein
MKYNNNISQPCLIITPRLIGYWVTLGVSLAARLEILKQKSAERVAQQVNYPNYTV